jgi:hypothetical protein
MNIWKRPSEWDYSWLASVPVEVRLCRIYEYARYALLSLDPEFVFPQSLPPGASPHLLAAPLGPILFLGCFCPTNFPSAPYRYARSHWKFEPDILVSLGLCNPFAVPRWTFDPEMMVAMIEGYCDPLLERTQHCIVPKDATAKQLSEKLLAQLPAQARPKRGAGARLRQDKTDLRCLAALKLLSIMSAPEAIKHTEAVLLERPLFYTESEWSRAKGRALRNLAPYQTEAEALFRAFHEKRKLISFSYLGGKSEIEWS